MATTSEILFQAARVIETGGLTKGTFGPEANETAPHCSIGAIRTAAHKLGEVTTIFAEQALADEYVRAGVQVRGVSIAPRSASATVILANDQGYLSGRKLSGRQVAAQMRKAARRLRKAGG